VIKNLLLNLPDEPLAKALAASLAVLDKSKECPAKPWDGIKARYLVEDF